MNVKTDLNGLYVETNKELLVLTPCADNAIRFRAFPNKKVIAENHNLIEQKADFKTETEDNQAFITVGNLKARIKDNGRVTFFFDGKEILDELPELTFDGDIRKYKRISDSAFTARASFKANDNEHFFGLGHHLDNLYDQKGCAFDIVNTNANCFIPYVYSSLGYGFLWNVPSTGRVELAVNRTRWTSDNCAFIDYVVIGGTPKQVCKTLADITGHASVYPEWAAGFWQCRLRYETQEQLLEVARRYKKENIPLSVIIADYFHWTEQGEYKFDPKYWPDVKAMTKELHEMGVRLYVSVWPTINENSENFEYMSKNDMLIKTKDGSGKVFSFYGPQHEIDATNEETRKFVWGKIKQNYIDNGVDGIWLDESEPEIYPVDFSNLIFSKGTGDAAALLSPYYYAKMVYDGMKEMGRDDIITLTRCAYFGNQKFGSLVWSGDIKSTFESLKAQVHGAINSGLCGLPWWNSDVGGFYGGDTTSDYFKELIIRWFQFGVFCPVLRLHGNRNRHGQSSGLKEASGDPNELWSFGEQNFKILKDLVALREKLKPYIKKYMDEASQKGYPLIRPMFFETPDDPVCYTVGEQYYFGGEMIFAPVVEQGQTEKTFYVPKGQWVLTLDGKTYDKGFHTVKVTISDMVILVKKDSDALKYFD